MKKEPSYVTMKKEFKVNQAEQKMIINHSYQEPCRETKVLFKSHKPYPEERESHEKATKQDAVASKTTEYKNYKADTKLEVTTNGHGFDQSKRGSPSQRERMKSNVTDEGEVERDSMILEMVELFDRLGTVEQVQLATSLLYRLDSCHLVDVLSSLLAKVHIQFPLLK